MKKLFLLILILASNLFGQGWNNIVTTSIIEPVETDIFTNSSGIHILIRTSSEGNIVYYNLNSEGDVVKTVTLETIGYFPNIVGSNDKIYAIYKTGNNIRVKYSTDNGSSWLTDIDDWQTTAYFCNGVDAVFELNYGVHIVWATQDNGASGFETYYLRLAPDNSWAEYKNVTDYSTAQTGGNPSVVVSPNRVHVSFNTDPTTNYYGLGDVITRDKYNGYWQDPQTVVSASGSSEQSVDERLLVRGDYLYLFYNCFISGTPNDLRFRTRNVNTTGWSGFTTIESGTLWDYEDAFEITKTINNNNNYIHILCKKYVQSIGWSYTYKYYNGTTWFTQDDFDHLSVALRQIGLSSVSNDLFCTWVKWESPIKYMRFRQYDAIPLAPQNLAVTARDFGEYSHPVLSWTFNNEPDVYANDDAYEIQRRTRPVPGNFGPWSTIGSTPGDRNSYTDYEIIIEGTGRLYQAEYRIRAKDVGNYTSGWSSSVFIYFGQFGKISNGMGTQRYEYQLSQNYPNPFNPTTTIDYSIQSAGFVTLKIYDILGTEMASLVDERKEAGSYSVEFNAANLPSGMYVYRLSTANFVDTKKLILLK